MTVSNIRRLPDGGWVDRSRPLKFRFNGKDYTGYSGDTLASALMANGVDVLSRSFKYHRPRGVQSVGTSDVSSMVQICGAEESPNVLASVQPLHGNLEARSVNCWPSVKFDFGAVISTISPIIPSGFYYKTFMWPHWHVFEPIIRKAAGFGKAPGQVADRSFQNRFDHCDVLVVGSGPSGLMAALSAARSDARVVLVDEMIHPGGSLLYRNSSIDGYSARQWVQNCVNELLGFEKVTHLQNATAWGYLEGNMVCVVERKPCSSEISECNWKIWANQVVLATGAIERPIVFANNDVPGVMQCSAVRAALQTYAVVPGKRALLFTNNDSAYETLEQLHSVGIEIAAVVDVRTTVRMELKRLAEKTDTEILEGYVVSKALVGRKRVNGVLVTSLTNPQSVRQIECDLVCISGGWNPAVHLFSQSRGSLKYDDSIAGFVPHQAQLATHVTGAMNGVFSLHNCLASGSSVGAKAATAAGFYAQSIRVPEVMDGILSDYHIEPFWSVETGERPAKAFIDMAGDVTVFDLRLAAREGYAQIEHLKRYTTTGMGLDQGKTANVNAIGIMANLTDSHPSEIGTTTFRPPYTPVEFGAIAGSRQGKEVLPYRHTPMTQWHRQQGAVMYEAGARWRRPGYYPKSGELMDEAVRRECRAVRTQVGMYDGSPLGKFELWGEDVVKMLNLVYTNNFERLKIGQGRYGIMLTEDGLIFDDGVTFRLDEQRYLMSCSTGGALHVESKLDQLVHIDQPDLKCIVTPVTSQWANATVCGPMARQLLETADTDMDFSRESLPFMQMSEGHIKGMPVRVFRVSFTGELSFEVNVPSRFGLQLWEYLLELGADWNICPVGSESSHVLRVEKGFLSLAHEADSTVDPIDLGMKWLIDSRKPDFIGKRAMEIRRRHQQIRPELVGLLPKNPNQLIAEGAPLKSDSTEDDSEGFVTASVWSDVCNRTIALALLNEGRSREGETVNAWMEGKILPAVVTQPIFYDPQGVKLRM